MVELFEEDGVRGAKRYLEHLKMEYAFWMDGAESLLLNQAYRSAVRMPDGSLLNRYWDDRDTRAMNRGLRTWKLPATRAVRQTRCIATCARGGVRLGLLLPLAARSVAARQHPHDAVYPHRSERLPVQAGKRHRQHLGVERG
jgi:alpha,alpha-trehalase